jgi:hypothetical protein
MVLQWLQDPSWADADRMLARESFAQHFCGRFKFHPIPQDEVKILVDQLLRCRQFMMSPNDTNVLFEIDRCGLDKKFGLQLTPPAVSSLGAVNWL